MLFSGFYQKYGEIKRIGEILRFRTDGSLVLYIYAMKAPMTRDRYQIRLAKFFGFIGITGTTVQEQSRAFAKKGKDDIIWALNRVLKFVQFQKDRVDKKEISGATVRNYVKSIKLFCEMADMPIPWKKITRVLSKGKKYADKFKNTGINHKAACYGLSTIIVSN